ncbi:chemotaxis protein CheW [Derxia gummosa]|uniref:Chemotaxis protein CheW n=1 Tax=Derxia gummosa DSM 723 TaxID=1121388 RepID=A0A8B6X112_9BURK|nr:chemotaxis protein CheW [Derxia gummosa]
MRVRPASREHDQASGRSALIEAALPSMRHVQQLERELHELQLRWDLVESTARMVCPVAAARFLSTLVATREQFGALQHKLLDRVIDVHLANKHNDLIARAQVTIDVLVRSLYERTADVGFIATDPVLVEFASAPDEHDAAVLRARLDEYRAKYTVYDEILLLDTAGRVLCRLEDLPCAAPDALADAPWFTEAMARPGFAQFHGFDPLVAEGRHVLVYAHRVEGHDGRTVGCVALSFGFETEMRAIFDEIDDGNRHAIVALVDEHGVAIASNRPDVLGVGEPLELPEPHYPVILHRDTEYLASNRETRGYQGYMGLPWRAVGLTRLEVAFRAGTGAALAESDHEAMLDAIMRSDASLIGTIEQATAIERGLEHVIWNGKLEQARGSNDTTGSASAVLDQIGEAGRRTTRIFAEGIRRLCALVADGRREQLRARAVVTINIVDRNLYERANDCRWWALNGALAETLAALRADPHDTAAAERATAVLGRLNALYTVYRRVALCDTEGRVLAVSRPADALPPDWRLPEELVRANAALATSQDYAVSAFEPTPLCDGEPTYLYLAQVRDPVTRRNLGSVVLAFDSKAEFGAMSAGAIPPLQDMIALLIRPDGLVIGSSDERWAQGEVFAEHAQLTAPGPGESNMQLVVLDGARYLAGVASSGGYREFKRSDGYHEPMLSLVLQPLPVRQTTPEEVRYDTLGGGDDEALRLGLFRSGELVLGIPVGDIVEAIRPPRIVPMPGARQLAGLVEHHSVEGTRLVPVIDFRLGHDCGDDTGEITIVVVRQGARELGLRVDRLMTVASVAPSRVKPAPEFARNTPWLAGMVTARGDASGGPLVAIVDAQKIQAGDALPSLELLEEMGLIDATDPMGEPTADEFTF